MGCTLFTRRVSRLRGVRHTRFTGAVNIIRICTPTPSPGRVLVPCPSPVSRASISASSAIPHKPPWKTRDDAREIEQHSRIREENWSKWGSPRKHGGGCCFQPERVRPPPQSKSATLHVHQDTPCLRSIGMEKKASSEPALIVLVRGSSRDPHPPEARSRIRGEITSTRSSAPNTQS